MLLLKWLGVIALFCASCVFLDKGETAYGIISLVTSLLLLISALHNPSKRKKIEDMTGVEFEHFCAGYLKQKGFRKIQTTPVSGDYGADLVAVDWQGKRWVFQCKRYSKNVGVKAIQEIHSARNHYGAEKAAVLTNVGFTRNAKKLAEENEIELFGNIGQK